MISNDQDRFEIVRLFDGLTVCMALTIKPSNHQTIFFKSIFYTICSSVIFLLISTPLSAQSSISTASFIKNNIQAFQKKINSTSASTSFETSWIKEMQLRTETKDFDFEQQCYTLRISPNSKKIRKAEVQLIRQLQESATLDQYAYATVFLKMAYEDWLVIYGANQTLQLNKELLIIYQDIETVLLELGQFDNLNIKDLLEVQRDITDTEINIETSQKRIQYYLPDQQADFSDMIPVEDIEQSMNGALFVSKNSRQADQKNILKSTMLASELVLKESEEKQWLDFFQIEFAGPYGDPFNEVFSIGAGFKIPNAKAGQLAIEELKIEQDQLQHKIRAEQAIQQEKINRQRQRLVTLLEEGRLFKTLTNRQNKKAAEIVRLAAQAEGATPLLTLNANVDKIKQQLNILKLELEIYESYIDYLALTEELFKRPFKNYLINN